MSKVLYIFKRQIRLTVCYISVNRIGEQQDLLSSHTDICTKYIGFVILYVLSVNISSALRHIINLVDKVHNCFFVGTCRAHYYNGFTVFYVKIDIVKDSNITELCRYILKLDITLKTGTFGTVMIVHDIRA